MQKRLFYAEIGTPLKNILSDKFKISVGFIELKEYTESELQAMLNFDEDWDEKEDDELKESLKAFFRPGI